jgi:hypothetical protein
METALPGFYLYTDLIDETFEQQLLAEIDSQTWIVDYARHLQYYGYRNELEDPYDLIPFPVEMPQLMRALSEQLVANNIVQLQPDQVIVNEYVPGEGIRPHKDRDYYENQICGVNLGSGCIMRFIRGNNQEVRYIEVPQRSVYVMQDDARKNGSMRSHLGKKTLLTVLSSTANAGFPLLTARSSKIEFTP